MLNTKLMNGVVREVRASRWAYAFLALPMLIIIVYGIIPVIWTGVISFQNYTPSNSFWVGLGNFRDMLGQYTFWISLRNTAIYTIMSVPTSVVITVLISFLVYQTTHRYQLFLKSAYYLPSVASGVVTSLVWMYMFDPSVSILNYLLGLLHVPPIGWLSDSNVALKSLVLMFLAGGQGFGVILMTAAMSGIPSSLYECARIDGATTWRSFLSITIPLLRPTILYLVITTTIASFQVFTPVYIMTQGGPDYATTTLVYSIYSEAFQNMNFGLAAAESMTLFFFIAVFAVIEYLWLAREVEY